MAEFLSAAWIAELDVAARGCTDLPAFAGRLVVEQVVHSARGDMRYQIRIDDGGARVTADGDDRADIVLLTDTTTALALHTGAWRAQNALASGTFKVRGNPDVLVRHREALSGLDRAFAGVRERTTFAPDLPPVRGEDATDEQ